MEARTSMDGRWRDQMPARPGLPRLHGLSRLHGLLPTGPHARAPCHENHPCHATGWRWAAHAPDYGAFHAVVIFHAVRPGPDAPTRPRGQSCALHAHGELGSRAVRRHDFPSRCHSHAPPRLALTLATAWAALLIGALAPSAASAYRAATADERAAIARDLGGSAPAECLGLSISTVDEAWASVWWDTSPQPCAEAAADGVQVMRLGSDGIWRYVTAGSDITVCPPEIPLAIGRDLRWRTAPVCRASRVYVLCLPRGQDYREPRVRPTRCPTLGPTDSFSEAANLRRLRWRRWGKPVATARGIELGWHRPFVHVRVRVRAYRLRKDCQGDRIYTRLRVQSRYGRLIVRFHTCPD